MGWIMEGAKEDIKIARQRIELLLRGELKLTKTHGQTNL